MHCLKNYSPTKTKQTKNKPKTTTTTTTKLHQQKQQHKTTTTTTKNKINNNNITTTTKLKQEMYTLPITFDVTNGKFSIPLVELIY